MQQSHLGIHARTIHMCAAVLLSSIAAAGCASSDVSNRTAYVPETTVKRPSTVLVYDFAVSPDDVVIDTFGPAFMSSGGSEAERAQKGREVAAMLSNDIVQELGKRGIRAERATQYTSPPLDAILVKGQFITVNEGDQAGRVTIGFGRGTSSLRAQVQTYQVTPQGLRQLHEAEFEAEGTKKPGMAVPIAGGAAVGSAATSAVVSGGVTLAAEHKGGIEGDVDRMAELFAERAQAFYKRRGWL